jgi:hypothetical protein
MDGDWVLKMIGALLVGSVLCGGVQIIVVILSWILGYPPLTILVLVVLAAIIYHKEFGKHK